MSLPDPSRAFRAGAVQANLNTAIEALVAAFTASLAAGGFNERTKTIDDALTLVKKAAVGSVNWHK